MGIDFGQAHWSYGGFARFCRMLAAAEGIDLDQMAGFAGWGQVTEQRSWEPVTSPLKPFLNHSDCDGELSPAECALVWPRLFEIIESWDLSHPRTRYDVEQARLLVAEMRECAENGTNLQFR